jgi:enoyl-CoA hydratase/carnithine racemase
VRLVDRTAYFAESWLDLGLLAPLGGTKWLPQIIGVGEAKEVLLECKRIGAGEAVAIGLASELLESSETLDARA